MEPEMMPVEDVLTPEDWLFLRAMHVLVDDTWYASPQQGRPGWWAPTPLDNRLGAQDSFEIHRVLASSGWAAVKCADDCFIYRDPVSQQWFHQDRAARLLTRRIADAKREGK